MVKLDQSLLSMEGTAKELLQTLCEDSLLKVVKRLLLLAVEAVVLEWLSGGKFMIILCKFILIILEYY